MENRMYTTEAPTAKCAGTYDFSNRVELVKVIDLAMRHYFGTDRWLAVRNRQFPGLRATV